MSRVQVTCPVVGICHMQVCAEADVTDAEVLAVCNRENPAGTRLGWVRVLRDEGYQGPIACEDDPSRVHLLVEC